MLTSETVLEFCNIIMNTFIEKIVFILFDSRPTRNNYTIIF